MGSCICVDKSNNEDTVTKRLTSDSIVIPKYDDLSLIPTNNEDWKAYIDSVLEDNMSISKHYKDSKRDNAMDIDPERDDLKYHVAISA
mmetsp:Transcript_46044/g.41208  ORF Transcript_46044/g.41208 Transcript_46044/m.41208 type:complete len:88 (-) Transcript_46044:136-399(-)